MKQSEYLCKRCKYFCVVIACKATYIYKKKFETYY